MPTVCIQCSMEAILNGVRPPLIEEEPEEHMRRIHPDPEATKRRRRELELELGKRLGLRASKP